MIEVGSKATNFALENDQGQRVELSKLKGHAVVLYFYPKDDTSGCTAEARDFSAMEADFAKAGALVFGVSPDSVESKAKFRSKHDLTVGLLADPDKKVSAAYGVWVEKSMYGRKYMGVERATFLIGPDGKVAAMWRKVKVPGHAKAVLEAVKALKA